MCTSDGDHTPTPVVYGPSGMRTFRSCSNVTVTENPVQNVTFPSNGGTAHGYLAVPESGSGPGVVVIQEWWG